jgi:methyl-accepting chemotaxis protein
MQKSYPVAAEIKVAKNPESSTIQHNRRSTDKGNPMSETLKRLDSHADQLKGLSSKVEDLTEAVKKIDHHDDTIKELAEGLEGIQDTVGQLANAVKGIQNKADEAVKGVEGIREDARALGKTIKTIATTALIVYLALKYGIDPILSALTGVKV